MKTSLFSILILQLFLFVSCSDKKDELEEVKPEGKKAKVTLSVDGSLANDLKNAEAAPPLKDLINQLTVILYRDGLEYTRVTQFSDDPSFGEFSFELPYENFQFVAIGSKTQFGINQNFQGTSSNPVLFPFKTANFQYWQPSASPVTKYYKTDDTFFAAITNSIFEGNLNLSLRLQRIVGKLEVNVTDLDHYGVDINNEATGFRFSDEVSFGSIENDLGYIVDNSNGPISVYILRTDKPLNIEVFGGGKRRVLNVPIYKNQRTIVSGDLLSPKGISALKVSVDHKWSADTTLIPL